MLEEAGKSRSVGFDNAAGRQSVARLTGAARGGIEILSTRKELKATGRFYRIRAGYYKVETISRTG